MKSSAEALTHADQAADDPLREWRDRMEACCTKGKGFDRFRTLRPEIHMARIRTNGTQG
ncbi:hypothetical protein [Bryobacter aggregatus]|uniref:hypothetical protein n=1 Tax=Bryobacter aggregatus TaxID=360054 RepID=UPI0012BA6C66|nr:hypothetical protein [Bryobacter aggregatus]